MMPTAPAVPATAEVTGIPTVRVFNALVYPSGISGTVLSSSVSGVISTPPPPTETPAVSVAASATGVLW